MAAIAIVTIEPLGYSHVRAFDEVRLLLYHSLLELGHEVELRTNAYWESAINIILGAHLLQPAEVESIPASSIVFNTEQLGGDFTTWANQIVDLAKTFPVWDYSHANLSLLRELVADKPLAHFVHLRLGYHPRLEKIERSVSRTGDFLFFGSMTPLREQILGGIRLSDNLRVQAFFGVYGWTRDGLLSRCAAALNIHSHASRILEWPRIIHLVANRVPCIALLHSDTYVEDSQLDYVLACDETDPTPQLEAFYGQPELLNQHADAAWERFRLEDQALFTQQALDQTYGSAPLPPSSPSRPAWAAVGRDDPVDVKWYLHKYQWTYSDPRDATTYHRQEGCFRQYHPSPSFIHAFKQPLSLKACDSAVAADAGRADGLASMRCAAVLHFHTPTKARQFFADFGCHLVGKVDFFITTSEALVGSVLLSLAQDYGIASMDVRVLPNIGRDIPSKYIVFNAELQAYDLCLFSHGKESDGQWFHDQNLMLAGSSGRVEAIKQLFVDQPQLGLIFPEYPSSLLWLIGWGNMRSLVDTLLAPLGCDTGSVDILEYPAGGFYWARPAALMILHSLGLTLESLPPEPLAPDNTLLHALERMPCLSCEMMGFTWEKIAREEASAFVSSPVLS